MERVLLRKLDIWAHGEWRHFSTKEGPGFKPFHVTAHYSSIWGADAHAPFEQALTELLFKRRSPLFLRRAKFDEKAISLHLV